MLCEKTSALKWFIILIVSDPSIANVRASIDTLLRWAIGLGNMLHSEELLKWTMIMVV